MGAGRVKGGIGWTRQHASESERKSSLAHFTVPPAGSEPIRYVFDKVFGMDSQQEEVYEMIGATAIEQMRNGFNSTVLAYGQVRSRACSQCGQAPQRL